MQDVLYAVWGIFGFIFTFSVCLVGYLIFQVFINKNVNITHVGYQITPFNGNSIKLTFRNHTLRRFVIKRISCIYNEQYEFIALGAIGEQTGMPFVLPPLETVEFIQEPFDEILETSFEKLTNMSFDYAVLETNYGKVIATFPNKKPKALLKNSTKLSFSRLTYNGKLFRKNCVYALVYWSLDDKNVKTTVFLYPTGQMSDVVYKFDKANGHAPFQNVPIEVVKNYDSAKRFFSDVFKYFNVEFEIIPAKDFK